MTYICYCCDRPASIIVRAGRDGRMPLCALHTPRIEVLDPLEGVNLTQRGREQERRETDPMIDTRMGKDWPDEIP